MISEVSGYANDVWRLTGDGEEVLVKLRNVPEEDPRQIDGYARAHTLMAAHGFPTPRLLALDRAAEDFEGRQASILQFWPGQTLTDSADGSVGLDAKLDQVESFGAITAHLHAVPVEPDARWIDDAGGLHASWEQVVLRTIDIAAEEVADADRSASGSDDAAQLAERAADRLRGLTTSIGIECPSLVHRDLHLGNVLFSDDNTPFIIDFEMVREWDPVFDLVKALSVLRSSTRATEAFLGAYESVRPLPEDWRWRLAVYQGLGSLLNVAELLDGNAAYRSSPDSLRTWLDADLGAPHG